MHLPDLPLYLAQSFTYSFVAVIAAYPLLRLWKVRNPRLRFNFHLMTLLLPVVLPALFYMAYPGRTSLVFRDRLALLDIQQWLELSVWGQFDLVHPLLLLFGAVAVVFVVQEIIPLATRQSSRTYPRTPIEPGRFPHLDEALAESSKLMAHPLPPVKIIESPGAEIHIRGVFRQVLVISSGIASSAGKEQLTAILCHEMAHLVRRDHWTGWALVLLRGVAFYNPIAWFTSRLMWQENEQVCDSMAVSATGNPLALASALVKVAGQTIELRPESSPATSPSTKTELMHSVDSHLAFRVRSLLEHGVNGDEWGAARLWTFSILLTAVLFFVV
ncbi:MAG: M56 family metallopeptidase [Dehalococcoidia bacterium]|nr:M56 family metallopeptidase [Dehalococcoidia bacterium]